MSKETAGQQIIEGLKEALAFTRGETTGAVVHPPQITDVRTVRRNTGLTQRNFAHQIGVPLTTLRAWERGTEQPQGPAHILIALLERDPNLIATTLSRPCPSKGRS